MKSLEEQKICRDILLLKRNIDYGSIKTNKKEIERLALRIVESVKKLPR